MCSIGRFPVCTEPLLRKSAAVIAICLAVSLVAPADATAQPALEFTVPTSPEVLHLSVPVNAEVKLEASDRCQLIEVDAPEVAIPVQLARAVTADGLADECQVRLLAAIPPREDAAEERRLKLQPVEGRSADAEGFAFKEVDDKSLGLWDGESPVLVYNHGMITKQEVPENDARRTRGCYVHPLYGLNGEQLTEDFPRDHYHHHGVFWTWPHVKIEEEEYDLWADRGIKQRFVRWLCRETGPVAAVMGVENGWFVGDRKVMIERVWFVVRKSCGDTRTLDLEFVWIPVDRPITLWGAGGKSYGGLTVRFAPPSPRDPGTVITVPSGRTEGDLPETPLAWADFTSRFGENAVPSGAAIFVSPAHPDYPPTWLTRYYGPLCVGWPGIEPKTFEPGEPIRLDYRIWIHKTAVETAEIQQAYDAYGPSQLVQ